MRWRPAVSHLMIIICGGAVWHKTDMGDLADDVRYREQNRHVVHAELLPFLTLSGALSPAPESSCRR